MLKNIMQARWKSVDRNRSDLRGWFRSPPPQSRTSDVFDCLLEFIYVSQIQNWGFLTPGRQQFVK